MTDVTPPSTLGDQLDALPEQHATKSRDYGRGYAQAVRDVRNLLSAHDESYLREDCDCEPWVVEMYAAKDSSRAGESRG